MSNPVAFVTGGASGIGAEVCRLLAEKGHRVAVCDVHLPLAQQVADEIGGLAIACNVADPNSIQTALETCQISLGAPLYVHLNAGVMTVPPDQPYLAIEDVSLEQYRRIMSINLDGVFHGLHAVIPLVRDQGGCITITASIAGLGFVPVDPLYTATKYAVIGLTRAVAAANSGTGLRLNAICPGVVDTAIVPESFKSRPMMPARVLAEEVVDLLTQGPNGEIRVKITEERPTFSVDPTPLA